MFSMTYLSTLVASVISVGGGIHSFKPANEELFLNFGYFLSRLVRYGADGVNCQHPRITNDPYVASSSAKKGE
jgi:hypothetical protein